jgi:hypothetical protein
MRAQPLALWTVRIALAAVLSAGIVTVLTWLGSSPRLVW